MQLHVINRNTGVENSTCSRSETCIELAQFHISHPLHHCTPHVTFILHSVAGELHHASGASSCEVN
jgi:hypothetical protein